MPAERTMLPQAERQPDKLVRLPRDLVDLINEFIEVEGGSFADFAAPLLRPEAENRHKQNLPAIKILRAARARAAKARDEMPEMTNTLGGEG